MDENNFANWIKTTLLLLPFQTKFQVVTKLSLKSDSPQNQTRCLFNFTSSTYFSAFKMTIKHALSLQLIVGRYPNASKIKWLVQFCMYFLIAPIIYIFTRDKLDNTFYVPYKFLFLSFKEKLKAWLLKSQKKITSRGIRYLTMEEDYKVPLVSQSYHSINKKSQEKKKACMC